MTPQQLLDAIAFEYEVTINYPSSPANTAKITDVTDWATLLGTGDIGELILKIVNPVGITIYENTGYAAGSFTSPDLVYQAQEDITKTLIAATGSNVAVAGDYTVFFKARADDGNGVILANGSKKFTVCVDLLRKAIGTPAYDCNADTPFFSLSDDTDLGAPAGFTYVGVQRTLSVWAPALSGQGVVTSSGTPLNTTNLFTGTYEWEVSGYVTFSNTDSVNGNQNTIVYYKAEGELKVECNNVQCKMYCALTALQAEYTDNLGANGNLITAKNALEKMMKGTTAYLAYIQSRICGQDGSSWEALFWTWTGISSNCNCCNDDIEAVAPVIGNCGCTDGENGKNPEFRVTEALMFQYRLEGDTAWIDLQDLSVLRGANGTNGLTAEFRFSGTLFQWRYVTVPASSWTTLYDFSAISTVLINDFTSVVSSGSGNTNFKTQTIPANYFSQNEDMVWVDAIYRCIAVGGAKAPNGQAIALKFNGITIAQAVFTRETQIEKIRVDVKVVRTSSSVAKAVGSIKFMNSLNQVAYEYNGIIVTPMTGINFTSALDIVLAGTSIASGDLAVDYFEVLKFKK